MANPYYVQPASPLPGLNAAFTGFQQGVEAKIQRDEDQQLASKRKELSDLYTSGSPEDVASFFIQNPDIAQSFNVAKTTADTMTRDEEVATAWDIYTGRVKPTEAMTKHAETVINRGGDAAESLQLLEHAKQDPEIIKRAAAGVLARYDTKGFEAYRKSLVPVTSVQPAGTDLERQAQDAVIIYKTKNPKAKPSELAKERMQARLNLKRAQAKEVRLTTEAKNTANISAAERLAYNSKTGSRLAEIETAGALIKAKGELTPEQVKANGRRLMSGSVAKLAGLYKDLDSMGAIINIDNSSLKNLWAATKSSAGGQFLSRVIGTKAQSVRDSINTVKPLIMQYIRQSTNMSARGLDSEKELAFYMQAVSNEKSDIRTNMLALIALDEAFGEGKVAVELRKGLGEPALAELESIKTQGTAIRQRGLDRAKAEEYLRQNPQFKEAFKAKYGYIPEGIK